MCQWKCLLKLAEVSRLATSGQAKVKISGLADSEVAKKVSGLAISGLRKNLRMSILNMVHT